jgi:hypothetical protein
MMKTLTNIILFILALAAWIIISISGEMLRDISGVSKGSIQYLVSLFLALAYAQWYLHRLLSPLQRLKKEDRNLLKKLTLQKYKKSFFAGTIGLGYLLALVYGVELLIRRDNRDTNFAIGAIFFILVGTIAQARALTSILVDQLIKDRKNIEPSAAVDAKEPALLS